MNEVDYPSLRFRRQWAILLPSDPVPELNWVRRPLTDGRILHVHEDAFFSEHLVGGMRVMVIGLAIQPDDAEADAWLRRVDGLASLEREVAGLCGQYVVVCSCGEGDFILTDPAAMCGVYYRDGRASSSPRLLPSIERDARIDREYPFQGTDDWYTGSYCPFVGVRFLLANHRLNVGSGEIRRFWSPACGERVDHREGVDECARIMRGTLERLVGRGRVMLSLTGGRDSRVNLAAARDLLDKITAFTLVSPAVKECDRQIPVELAGRFGFRHQVVEIPPSDPRLVDLYDEISGGMAIGARRGILSACLRVAGRDVIHLNGNLGAITKSFFWPNRNPESVTVDALMREFSTKAPTLREGVIEWLGSLPAGLPPAVVYNLMYLEQRGGRWMGPGENASSMFYGSCNLFNSRRLFEVVCGMDLECQYGGRLLGDFAESLWPEAAAHRYCRNTRNLSSFLPRKWKSTLKSWCGRH